MARSSRPFSSACCCGSFDRATSWSTIRTISVAGSKNTPFLDNRRRAQDTVRTAPHRGGRRLGPLPAPLLAGPDPIELALEQADLKEFGARTHDALAAALRRAMDLIGRSDAAASTVPLARAEARSRRNEILNVSPDVHRAFRRSTQSRKPFA
jgi:hypothetical protein